MQVPFSPLPLEKLRAIAQKFIPLGLKLKKMFPNLELQLQQADMDMNAKEYLAIIAFLSIFYLIFFSLLFTILLTKLTPHFLLLGTTVGLVASFLIFMQMAMFPTMQIRKKEREIEKNLLFGLRTILIEIRSGVTLFESMKTIAKSDYGKLSTAFKQAVDEINTGVTYDEALQKLATENPSPYFRKAIWQIVNGMKAGGDITSIIKETVSSTTRDQKISINKYAGKLRVLSLGYMMIGIILPGLGLTIVMVIGSLLAGIMGFELSEPVFIVLLVAIAFIQLMYIGIIKSQRPTMMT